MVNSAAASTGGRPASTHALMRPCADTTRICRLTLEALAHHVGEVVEHLGEVAARLALRQHRGDEEARVEHRHALAIARSASGSDMPKFCSS